MMIVIKVMIAKATTTTAKDTLPQLTITPITTHALIKIRNLHVVTAIYGNAVNQLAGL
jgi:hypothetical protein